jgi:hypothetical protein
MQPSCVKALLALAAIGTANVVRAQDQEQLQGSGWPRYYVGLGFGESELGLDLASAGAPDFASSRFGRSEPEPSTAWKIVAGFRPVRVVGAEIQYVDFGVAEIPSPSGNAIIRTHFDMESRADAIVMTALLFIPERSPAFDIYGKVGVAQLDESFQAHALLVDPSCTPFACQFSTDIDRTDSRPYLGIGARIRVGREIGFRIEYEEIDRDGDSVTLLSVGLAWER